MATQKLLYRFKSCGCDCATIPVDPCLPCNAGAYQLQCRSRSGLATLSGYPEYTNASLPPKKYRQKNFGGSVSAQIRSSCPAGDVLRVHNSSFAGVNVYNSLTGEVTRGSASTGTAAPKSGFDSLNTTAFADSYIAIDGGFFRESLTRTSRRVQYVSSLGGTCATCVASRQAFCDEGVEVLSQEDKEDDAIARVAAEWSPWMDSLGGCCTTKAARAAGEFTFPFSQAEWRFRVAGSPGTPVRVEVSFTRSGFAPFTIIVQDVATSPSFPADPAAGWSTSTIQAMSGSSTCLVSHKLYTA